MSNEELLARIDERQRALTDRLDQILEQTTKTNGRVTKCEDTIHELKLWQSETKGSWKGIVTVSAIVGAIISFIANIITRQ